MSIIKGRVTARRNDNFVLFLIGMRINNFWKIHKWLPIFFQMPKMIKELESDKSLGYLNGEAWFGRNIIFVQYWKSFNHLEKFARSKDYSHFPAWQKFLKKVGPSGDVGIWHETYEIKTINRNIIHEVFRFDGTFEWPIHLKTFKERL